MKKRVLFIDRDGTLIVEPPVDFQVDSFEKLAFLPHVFSSLKKVLAETDFVPVMVTNQDGLGTESFPEDTFWPVHNKMLQIFEDEGITFENIHIDKTFEHENKPTRKPGTAMLSEYFSEKYDLAGSYVLGDRLSDLKLAENLGAGGIFVGSGPQPGAAFCSADWREIAAFLLNENRAACVQRSTNETEITVKLNLDGSGRSDMSTGLGFLDHMLDQVARHSGCDLEIKTVGDLHIDDHHTAEDTALALGEAFRKALREKRGINRYGFFLLPMDEALAQVAIDFSGRPQLVWNVPLNREKVGDLSCEIVPHFFKSFCDTAGCNLNIRAEGENAHHIIEAIFKGFARAIGQAVRRESNSRKIPSTKGVL